MAREHNISEYELGGWKEGGFMFVTEAQKEVRSSDASKLELYRLIGEGYKAIQDGRVSPLEDVKERIDKRRKEYGQSGLYRAGGV